MIRLSLILVSLLSSSVGLAAPANTTVSLVSLLTAQDVANNFEFQNYEDGISSSVYVDQKTATEKKLFEVVDDVAYIKSGGFSLKNGWFAKARPASVRLKSHANWRMGSGTLFVLDVNHIPSGCGVFSSWWFTGPELWPTNGEVDSLEYVNNYTKTTSSLHYGSAKDQSNYNPREDATDKPSTVGKPVNDIGGGIYVLSWGTSTLTTYFFPRKTSPEVLGGEEKLPAAISSLMAGGSKASVDSLSVGPDWSGFKVTSFPREHWQDWYFQNLQMIFVGQLCGWAGAEWSQSKYGYELPGTPTCARSTGYSTCEEYVVSPAGLSNLMVDSVWAVNQIRVYQSDQTPEKKNTNGGCMIIGCQVYFPADQSIDGYNISKADKPSEKDAFNLCADTCSGNGDCGGWVFTKNNNGWWCQLFKGEKEVVNRFPQYCNEVKAGVGLTSQWVDGAVSGGKRCGPH